MIPLADVRTRSWREARANTERAIKRLLQQPGIHGGCEYKAKGIVCRVSGK